MTECPYHAPPKYRECHHIGGNFVAVHRDHTGVWLATFGSLDSRGSITAIATPDTIDWQISVMRERAEGADNGD